MSELVIAGGKGLDMFEGARIKREYLPADLRNPYGEPSGKVAQVEWNNASFFCFSRHGDQQQLAPAEIPYLANAYALKQLGVKYWVSVSLATALKGSPEPGCLVVADDYTALGVNRPDQFLNAREMPGLVLYIDNFKSVSAALKGALAEAASKSKVAIQMNIETDPSLIAEDKLLVYAGVNGPETGTVVEQQFLTAPFKNVISGMTNMTEALVCRQAGIDFAGLSFIGGRNLNYSGVQASISRYLAGISEKVVPLLADFVQTKLPERQARSQEEFFAMCTGPNGLIEAVKNSREATTEGERQILQILRVLLA